MKRVSLGFDLRVDPNFHREVSSQIGQRLVPEISDPISADPNVWPQPPGVASLWQGALPEFSNPLNLARSLALLRDASDERAVSVTAATPVCLTSFQTNIVALVERFGTGYFDDQTDEKELLSQGWQFMGFDVVDLDGLISGLKGCGYAESSRSQLRSHFGASLNNLGLFTQWEVAARFAEVRGLQMRKHSPFVVVGVFVHARNYGDAST